MRTPRHDGASLDHRLIAATRLILASAGLLIILLVPTEPSRLVGLTYAVLVSYTVYSLAVYGLFLAGRLPHRFFLNWGHWIDVGWYTGLIGLTSGTNSVFFFGFVFAILVASFRWGFASGSRVAVVSAILFTTFGYITAPDPPQFEQRRFLIRPVYLLVLGYLSARWGEHEIMQRRRLEFLKEIAAVSNPRFGVDATLGMVLHRLVRFFDADACLVLLKEPLSEQVVLRRIGLDDTEGPAAPVELPEGISRPLLALPSRDAVAYNPPAFRCWTLRPASGTEPAGGAPSVSKENCEAIATLLEAESFLSVPLTLRSRDAGRLLLICRRSRVFDQAEAEFLMQVADQTTPRIENLLLLDRLASAAANEERRRIARDLHDSVVQPYIGLQMGLGALLEKVNRGETRLKEDIETLLNLAQQGVDHLRGRVLTLRKESGPAESLVPALQRFVAQFSETMGIAVHLEVEGAIRISDRLAAEAFQMVAEALSNVRRHTGAARAAVRLRCMDHRLVLRIENEGWRNARPRSFMPRSIAERAAALGGQASVELTTEGGAIVGIEIPM